MLRGSVPPLAEQSRQESALLTGRADRPQGRCQIARPDAPYRLPGRPTSDRALGRGTDRGEVTLVIVDEVGTEGSGALGPLTLAAAGCRAADRCLSVMGPPVMSKVLGVAVAVPVAVADEVPGGSAQRSRMSEVGRHSSPENRSQAD